jgi:hypothetical protein
MNGSSLRIARWKQGFWLFVAGGGLLYTSLNLFVFLGSNGKIELSKNLSVASPGLWIAMAVFYPLLIALLFNFARVIPQLRSAWIQGFQLALLWLAILLPWLLLHLFFTLIPQMGAVDLESRMGKSVHILAWLVFILLEPFWAFMVLKRLPRLTQTPLCQGWLTRLTGHTPYPPVST